MVNFAPGFEPHFDDQEVGGIGLCPELLRAMEGVKYIAEVTRIMEDSNKVNWLTPSYKPLHQGNYISTFYTTTEIATDQTIYLPETDRLLLWKINYHLNFCYSQPSFDFIINYLTSTSSKLKTELKI